MDIDGRERAFECYCTDLRGREKITWNFSYQFMEQWCNSIAAKHHIFLG